jgi:eukaryotic-like serine/threonine-protein kinase
VNPSWSQVESLLDEVLELAAEERPAFLERIGARAPELRAEVEHWLRATELPDGFLDQSGPEYVAPLVSATEEIRPPEGTRIGPYRIMGVAGHGGMGTVFLAERDEPYHQRVALKLVRGAVALDDHVVRRLVEERRILASLEHPHIARLVDGGVTEDGLPWFAMEYVQGRPIDHYCEQLSLQLHARLQLFLTVCDAVQFAHRNLVVHRDLKPSNILVTGDGEVKLLDFGIAKLLAEGRSDAALTETGVRVLTPQYASPEQIRGDPIAVTSDVYSLGVLLYELLTGRRPHHSSGLNSQALEHATLQQPPPRPSTVVSDPRLGRRLRGDLDIILLTALRKEPERRYPSVERFATDIRRFLGGLPITARPDTWRYRAGKFVRRHRLSMAAGAAVGLSLVGGLIGTTWQARVAERAAAKERAVKNFLVGLFQVSDPTQSRGRDISARELLDRGARRAESALAATPDLQSELLHVLGIIHSELGLLGRADTLLERAVRLSRSTHGERSAELAARLTDWGILLTQRAQFTAADSILRSALAIRRRVFGPRDSSVAATLRALGEVEARLAKNDAAESLYREALATDRSLFGDEHLSVASDLDGLGTTLYQAGRMPGADSVFRAGLAIRRRLLDSGHPLLLISLDNVAQASKELGNYGQAERLQREVLEQRRRLHPQGHPELARTLRELASVVAGPDRPDSKSEEAESLFVEAIAMQRTFLGFDHPETILTLNNRAPLRYWNGDLSGAETDLREVVGNWQRTLGKEHQNTLMAMSTLGTVLRDEGRYDEAEPLLRQALSVRRKLFGDSHGHVAQGLAQLAKLHQLRGDYRTAEQEYREALAIDRKLLPAGHPVIAWRLNGLGEALTGRGKVVEAEPLLREALTIRLEKLGPHERLTSVTRRALGVCLMGLGRHQEAEQLLVASYESVSDGEDYWSSREAAETAKRLAEFYGTRGRAAQAAHYRAMAAKPGPLTVSRRRRLGSVVRPISPDTAVPRDVGAE